MKTFKQHTKEKKLKDGEGSGVIPAPIHFKHFADIDIGTGVIPAAIHFKHVHKKKREKLDEVVSKNVFAGMVAASAEKVKNKKPKVEKNPFLRWVNDTSDNDHLSILGHGKKDFNDSRRDDNPRHTEIANKLHSTNKFTANHEDAIKGYTNDSEGGEPGSQTINKPLIKGKFSSKTHQKNVEDHAKQIDKAIDKNKIQHDVHVYSGTSFDPMKHMDKEGRLRSPAYISATHSRAVAAGYAQDGGKGYNMRHIIHIDLKKGDPATHVSRISDFKGEHETLIKRGTTLQHHGYEDHGDSDGETWYRIHHMSIAKD